MKWVSVWTSVTLRIQDSQFSIHSSIFIKAGINYQALVVLDHSLILCFGNVITASRITLIEVTSNYNFYGMI